VSHGHSARISTLILTSIERAAVAATSRPRAPCVQTARVTTTTARINHPSMTFIQPTA